MKRPLLTSLLAAGLLSLTALAHADSFINDGIKYSDARIVGLKDGHLNAIVGNNERQYPLLKIELIAITNNANNAKFTDAEAARSDSKKAVALYNEALRLANGKEMKLLIQARLIAPLDAEGKWSDAVSTFLDVYAAAPTDAAWELRPKNLPAAKSTLLDDSVKKITARINTFKDTTAQRNLKILLLDIYTKNSDPKAAALAKELGLGTPELPTTTANTATVAVTPNAGADLAAAEAAYNAKKYDDAIKSADAALETATGDAAIKLYNLKAGSYLAQDKLEEAALSYLRITVHYSTTTAAPTALLQAADIEKKLKHDDAAKRLYKEIVEKYPSSPAALQARKHL